MSSYPEEKVIGLWSMIANATDNQCTGYHMALSSYHLHMPFLAFWHCMSSPVSSMKRDCQVAENKNYTDPHSHKTFLPTSLHWYCQISPQDFLWFIDDLMSSDQIDLVIKQAAEMQGCTNTHSGHREPISQSPWPSTSIKFYMLRRGHEPRALNTTVPFPPSWQADTTLQK